MIVTRHWYSWCAWLTAIHLFCGSCHDDAHRFQITEVKNPSAMQSGEVSIAVSPDRQLYLSWVEELDSLQSAFKISKLQDQSFQTAHQVASGDDWFINWADFPAIGFIGQSPTLFAHWLQMSAEGTYDYDIRFALGSADGSTWQAQGVLHNDGIAAEHGFVSSCTVDESLLAVWLDGRQTKLESATSAAGDHGHDHGHGGAMTLRSALIDQHGNVSQRLEIDSKVCDCCQTDVALSDCGPIAVYRDRSDAEVRDIYFSILDQGAWSQPQPVHQDGWTIAGCPVNGPRIASAAGLIAVAWYTESGGFRKTLLSTSSDCGKTFSKPVILSYDAEAMGRIDIQINHDQEIYISYMEEDIDDTSIWIAQCNAAGELLHKEVIARNKKSRKSGFPRMAIYDNQIYIAYRDILNSDRIRVIKLS